MINVDLHKRTCELLVNQHQGAGYMKEKDYHLFEPLATNELLNEGIDLFQKTQVVTELVRPFIKKQLLIQDAAGNVTNPADYRHYIQAYVYHPDDYAKLIATVEAPTAADYARLRVKKVTCIDSDKYPQRSSSRLFRPTHDRPVLVFGAGAVKLDPIDVGTVFLDYFKEPTPAKWAYTAQPGQLPQYTPNGSVHLEWNMNAFNKHVAKTCFYFGVEVRESQLLEAAKTIDQTN